MTSKDNQTTLAALVADPEILLALEPEELAGFVLKELIAQEQARTTGAPNRYNFSLRFKSSGEDVQQAIMEAWIWLEREGCIAPKPEHQADWVFVTRQGKRLAESHDTSAYRRVTLLPKEFLHPVIAQKVWSAFIRGEYDTAVFQAFKQIEVAVRQAASFNTSDVGVRLMRKAFHPENGPLSDQTALLAER